jgi:LPS sulfotransferase NodH
MSKLYREFTHEQANLKKTHIKLFEWLASLPNGNVKDLKTFCILCTPRCGSTLFSDTLSRTGLIGWCEEWLNYEYFAAFQKVMGFKQVNFPSYFDFVKRKSVGDTEVFSVKCHIGQLAAMNKDFDFTFRDMDPDYSVYLNRKNKVAQAVSLSKAVSTDMFRHNEEGKEGKFDLLDVSKSLQVILSQDKSFRLALADKVAEEFYYEDFESNREAYDKTLKALGLNPPEKYETKMIKQRDEESEIMTETFIGFITGDYQ